MRDKEMEQAMIEEIEELLDELINYELTEDEYDDLLDELYDDACVGNMNYSASEVLFNCDRIAYNCGLGEEEDYIKSDKKTEIEALIDEYEEDLPEDEVERLRQELDEAY